MNGNKPMVGHEFMRQLCSLNPQFASSVLEDYIRPIVRDEDVVLEIECGTNSALLYLSRLCQGSKGPCIWFQEAWLTPNEFQYISGRETAKDWKRSIRHCGKSMKLLLTKGILSTHPPICDCDGCRISSPVNRMRLSDIRKSDFEALSSGSHGERAWENNWWNSAFFPQSRNELAKANSDSKTDKDLDQDRSSSIESESEDESKRASFSETMKARHRPNHHFGKDKPTSPVSESSDSSFLCRLHPCNDSAQEVSLWSVDQVGSFVRSLLGDHSLVETFRKEGIDGQSLLLLTEDHLLDHLSLCLGHAIKLLSAINKRSQFCQQCNHCLSCHSH